jgi:anti-anti-sigma factor
VGEFDVDAAPALTKIVADQIERGERRFVIDLDKLTFVDSRGIGALIEAVHKVRSGGGDACLVLVSPTIARTLAIAGVDRVLPIVDTRQAALLALRTARGVAIA